MASRFEVFKGAMAACGLALKRDVTDAVLDVYWQALSDLNDLELAHAFSVAITRCKFFPVPAELREFARPARTIDARAAVAWAAVRDAIRRHDYTVAAIDFGPLTNTVLRAMGSWEWLCEQTPAELVWREKDFARYFEAFASGPPAALRPDPLEGWGRGRVGCEAVAVPIDGEAVPARLTLAAKPSTIAAVVRELAEAKSQPGAATGSAGVTPHAAPGHDPGAAPPPREVKHEKITEDEKRAAIAHMEAQLAERAKDQTQGGGT